MGGSGLALSCYFFLSCATGVLLGSRASRVAVCLRGQLRGGSEVVASIEDRLLRPLQADTFVYVNLRRIAGTLGREEKLQPAPNEIVRLYSLPGLVTLHIETENATARLEAAIKKLYPDKEKAQRIYDMTRQVSGPWLGGLEEPSPRGHDQPSWRRPSTGLFQAVSWQRCLEMVQKAEENAGGRRYDWIVISRLEFFWEHSHIPLELLSRDAIWIPEGNDYGGLNDRHAVIPRGDDDSLSQIYLGAFSYIASGASALALHEAFTHVSPSDSGCDEFDGHVQAPCTNSEVALFVRLSASRTTVKRLPPLSWVVCRRGTGESTAAWYCTENGTVYTYEHEYSAATQTSSCLSKVLHSGGEWWDWIDQRLDRSRIRAALAQCWCPSSMESQAQACDTEADDRFRCYSYHYALCM